MNSQTPPLNLATIGTALGKIVADDLADNDQAEPPILRLDGFVEEEVPSIVDALRSHVRFGEQGEPPRIIVGSERPIAGVDPGHLLSPDRTLTYYRNRNDHGLILIELDPQSDAQGLSFIDTLSDSDILRSHQSATTRQRLRHITTAAWSGPFGDSVDTPELLHDAVLELFTHLEPITTPALRQWVTFICGVVDELASAGTVHTGPFARSVLQSQLPRLGLFPDEQLFERPAAIGRRLEKNYNYAQRGNAKGRDLPPEKLEQLIEESILRGPDDAVLPATEATQLKAAMHEVADGVGAPALARVPLRIWDQLFNRPRDVVGLGGIIRADLEKNDPDRLGEFDDLEVEAGLDDGDSEAANTLLRAEPEGDEPGLADAISASLRRKVERIVFQGERAHPDPLRAILAGLRDLESPDESETTVALEWDRLPNDAEFSARLFGILYGPTLAEIVDASATGLGHRFTVEQALLQPGVLRDRQHSSDSEESEDAEARRDSVWAPLRLRLVSPSSTPLRFRWDPQLVPGLVAFGQLLGRRTRGRLDIESLERLSDAALDPTSHLELSEGLVEQPGELLARWWELEADSFERWATGGLRIDTLDDHVARWGELVSQAAEEYIPEGSPIRELTEFLQHGTARCEDGRAVMLATHPLRLRWIRHHLSNLKSNIERALDGDLVLNQQNENLYFDWINRVSPHRTPPLLSPDDRELAVATREYGWHEEYTPIAQSRARKGASSIDDASIDELVGACRSFLEAFPHKREGLAVLFMARSVDPESISDLTRRLRRNDFDDSALVLHICASQADHDRLEAALSEFDTPSGHGASSFPPFQLVLHAWEEHESTPAALEELTGRIDIALAPNLFGVDTEAQDQTRPRIEGAVGRFDPWLDPTSHVFSSEGSGMNVSQVLLPPTPDPLLEAWSTLNVRNKRRQSVGADLNAVDYVTLQVLFDQHQQLFDELHSVAHWVVTLDPHIGRSQVDALEHRPDVIVVKEGVGKNEGYTLLISSRAGADFVVRRLADRLHLDLGRDQASAEQFAARLYEIGRNVAPGVMLRALGLGRTTEEIIGLVFARFFAEHLDPFPDGERGADFWVGLDEHTHWFGGPHRMRADLLRVRVLRSDDELKIRFTIVESKFRQHLDLGVGDEQINQTEALLQAAFADPTESEPADRPFWLREMYRSLHQLPQIEARPADLPAVSSHGVDFDLSEIRDQLLSNEFECIGIDGLLCGTAWADHISKPIGTTDSGHRLVRIGIDEVDTLLRAIGESAPPALATGLPTSEGEPLADRRSPRGGAGDAASRARSDAKPTQAAPQTAKPDQVERGIGTAGLALRYQTILDQLDQLGVHINQPPDGQYREGPGFAVYRVVPATGVQSEKVMSRTADLKLALGLPAEDNIRAFVDRGAVVFEVPKDDHERFVVHSQELWESTRDNPDSLKTPIGVDIDGDTIELDFSSSDTPHLLIAGQTGSGKSVALETILQGLVRRKSTEELHLHLIDPKGTELLEMADDPHVQGEIGYSADDACDVLGRAVEEMERRFKTFRTHRARDLPQYNRAVDLDDRLPWWLVVLDEYADLTSDNDDRKAIEALLRRIAQKGRSAGIHLIVATQRPSADVIGTVIRSNLPAQLALRVKSATDSRIILDEAGAESLSGKGDAFLRTTRGTVRLQCALS